MQSKVGSSPGSPSGCVSTELRASVLPVLASYAVQQRAAVKLLWLPFHPQLLGSTSPEAFLLFLLTLSISSICMLELRHKGCHEVIVNCEGFFKSKVNSVLNVAQSWRCGLWRRCTAFSSENTTAVSRPECCFIPHLPCSTGLLSLGSGAGGLARSHWEGNYERGHFEGSCICQWLQSPSSVFHDSGMPQGAAEEAGCLAGRLFYFHHSAGCCLQCWKDMIRFWKTNLIPCIYCCDPVSLSGLLKSCMRTCI